LPRKAIRRRKRPARRSFWEQLGVKVAGLPGRALRAAAQAVHALKTDRWAQLLLVVLLFAAVSRLMQPDWYGQRQFHPDERWIFQKVAQLSWPGEPGADDSAGLQYGSLPLYQLAMAKDIAHLAFPAMDVNRFVIVAGRALAGVWDILAVLMAFALGAKLFDRRTGLLAAAFIALTPLHIQLAHFFCVDPLLGLLSLVVLYAAAGVMQGGGWGWSLFSGLALGASLATKTSALPLCLPIALAHGLSWWNQRRDASAASRALLGLAVAAGASLLAFAACMPWALIHFDKFVRNQQEQQNILVTGSPDGTPFVRQYWDTLPVLFHLKNLFLYYQGPVLGGLALLALAWQCLRLLPFKALRLAAAAAPKRALPLAKARRLAAAAHAPAMDGGAWLLLAWLLPYLLAVGFSFAKFARYMLPFIPALSLLLAHTLAQLWDRGGALRKAALALAVAALAWNLGYSIGYLRTYTRPHPWVAASQWLFKNVPAQQPDGRRTVILNESWGDDLPVWVDGRDAGAYQNWQINIVEWDSPAKLNELGEKVSKSDILVLADPRAYGTYLRLGDRFPLTCAYYDLLFKDPGRLGFERALDQRNQPSVFGLEVDDSRTPDKPQLAWADESFTLYDHPRTLLFRRVRPLDSQAVQKAITDHAAELGLPDGWRTGMGPDQMHALARGGGKPVVDATEGAINPNIGLSRGASIALAPAALAPILWWAILLLLTLLAAPIAVALLGDFPDQGWALAKVLGLLLFSWLAFWAARLGLAFHQGQLWLQLGLLALAALALASRRRAKLAAWWQRQRGQVLAAEALFAGAFLFFVLLRSLAPNVHDIAGQGYNGGGEPLGMTYLSALLRCSTFPAYDPWLALNSSSYYYFGYQIAATLAKLSGIPANVAYNLSLALFFGLSVLAAYGVALALAGRRRFGLMAAGAVAMAGSLWTVPYLVRSFFTFGGVRHLFAGMLSFPFIWDPTRFPELVNNLIFEFPYFSYTYGDLHPHNMVLPFALLFLGLLARPFLSRETGLKALGETWPRRLLLVWLLALTLDAQYCINAWNWPVALALALPALLLALWVGRPGSWPQRCLHALLGLAVGLIIAPLGRLLFHAFHAGFAQGVDQVGRVDISERQAPGYLLFAFFALGLMGLFSLWPLRLQAWLTARDRALGYLKLAQRGPMALLSRLPERLWLKMPVPSALLALVLGLLGLSMAMGLLWPRGVVWVMGFGLAAFCASGLAMLMADAGPGAGAEAFAWVLGFISMAVVVGSEFRYVADRMNTLFKFYFQAWAFMGLVYAVGASRSFKALEAAPAKPRRGRGRAKAGLAWGWVLGFAALAVALLFLAGLGDYATLNAGGRCQLSLLALLCLMALPSLALLFPGRALKAAWLGALLGLGALGLLYFGGASLCRVALANHGQRPSLDGTAFMASMEPRGTGRDNGDYDKDDYSLIQWLNQNADRTEAVLEAPGQDMYKGYSRFAIYTGLPTVLGWEYQVGQQLGVNAGSRLTDRDADIRAIYTTTDDAQALRLLAKYHVRWVVVGGLERKNYAGPGLEKFSHLLKLAQQSGPSLLYRVPGGA
jgi:YYY domain-containing protein